MPISKLSSSRRLLLAAVALFVLLGLGIDWWKRRSAHAPARAVRLTSGGALNTEPAISPDGKLIAYASDRGGDALKIWVQPVRGGGWERHIGSAEGDCHSPAFSADGAQLAWRCEGGEGALFADAVQGSAPRKLAVGGRDPRYSPDGRYLAWWVRRSSTQDEVWAARADGSEPRRLCPQCETSRFPVWAPDSRRVVFVGSYRERYDWYAATLDGGPPTATGAYSILHIQNLGGTLVPTAWARNGILFTAQGAKGCNIWRMPISPDMLQCTTAAEPVTSGSGLDANAAATATGAVVYSSGELRAAVWELPLSGEPRRLLDADPAYPQFSVSADGGSIALRRGNEFYVRLTATGEEKTLRPQNAGDSVPLIAPDGSRVAYHGGHGSTWLLAAAGGEPEEVRVRGGVPAAWSPDGSGVLCQGWRRSLTLIYPASPRDRPREIVHHPEAALAEPRFSPDGRWIVLYTRDRGHFKVWIVPFREGPQPEERDWIAITADNADGRNPVWSGDGNLLYYLSDREGFRCIWAQALDPSSKRPRGAPFAVRHFHSARRGLTNPRNSSDAGLAAAGGKLFMTLFEATADIWILPAGR